MVVEGVILCAAAASGGDDFGTWKFAVWNFGEIQDWGSDRLVKLWCWVVERGRDYFR